MSAKLFEGFNLSVNYAKYRVSPPQQLITSIIEYLSHGAKTTEKWNAAVDVGCGSGQATKLIAPYFERVFGFDSSETQIKEAVNNNVSPNIEYKVAPAESLPVEKQSVNLITASQAAHWFNLPKFYNEATRVLAPKGVVAIFGYKMPNVWRMDDENNDKFKTVIYEAYKSPLLAPHWNKQERSMVDTAYKDIVLPFNDFVRMDDRFKASITLTVDEMAGYITSWSGFNVCVKKSPNDAKKVLEEFRDKVKSLCGSSDPNSLTFKVVYSFVLLMARV